MFILDELPKLKGISASPYELRELGSHQRLVQQFITQLLIIRVV